MESTLKVHADNSAVRGIARLQKLRCVVEQEDGRTFDAHAIEVAGFTRSARATPPPSFQEMIATVMERDVL